MDMFLFLILLFPIAFFIWCRVQGIEKFPKHLLIFFMGLFPAAVYCAYKFFFSPFYYLPQDSFLLNFCYLFLTQIFVPILVLIAVFMLLNRKDSIAERFENIFPFFAGFYAVFLPFRVLSDSLPLAFFLILVKPLIYFFMVLTISKNFKMFFAGSPSGKKPLLIAGVVFSVVLPAAIESLWMIGVPEFLSAALSVVCIAACAVAVAL